MRRRDRLRPRDGEPPVIGVLEFLSSNGDHDASLDLWTEWLDEAADPGNEGVDASRP